MSEVRVRDKVLAITQAACAAAGGNVQVALDTRLGELSIDSMKLLEIVFQLETMFSVQADEELLAQLETVGDLVAVFDAALLHESQSA